MGTGTKEGHAQCCSVKGSHLVFWKVDAMWALKKNNNKLLGVRGGQTVIEEEELGRFGLFPMCSVMSYIKVSLVAELWDF